MKQSLWNANHKFYYIITNNNKSSRNNTVLTKNECYVLLNFVSIELIFARIFLIFATTVIIVNCSTTNSVHNNNSKERELEQQRFPLFSIFQKWKLHQTNNNTQQYELVSNIKCFLLFFCVYVCSKSCEICFVIREFVLYF